jgi:hypothetical protein
VAEKGRAPLRELFIDLEQLEDLYTTHAVQYAGEIGPAVERFRHHLGEARKAR